MVETAEAVVWKPVWYKLGAVEFAAFGDRLLIIEDEFRSGYECRGCGGSGKRDCENCQGRGRYFVDAIERKCSACSGTGKETCSECGGKGGLIVVPEVSQRRPSTGSVVSVGHLVEHFKVGDNVLYSNFAGHAMDIGDVTLRILHEKE